MENAIVYNIHDKINIGIGQHEFTGVIDLKLIVGIVICLIIIALFIKINRRGK